MNFNCEGINWNYYTCLPLSTPSGLYLAGTFSASIRLCALLIFAIYQSLAAAHMKHESDHLDPGETRFYLLTLFTSYTLCKSAKQRASSERILILERFPTNPIIKYFILTRAVIDQRELAILREQSSTSTHPCHIPKLGCSSKEARHHLVLGRDPPSYLCTSHTFATKEVPPDLATPSNICNRSLRQSLSFSPNTSSTREG